jgi:hypothetical protein
MLGRNRLAGTPRNYNRRIVDYSNIISASDSAQTRKILYTE